MPAPKELCVYCGDGSGGGARDPFEEMCEACQHVRCSSCGHLLDGEDDDRCVECLEAALEEARECWHDEQRAMKGGTW